MEAGLAAARHPESVQLWHDGENIAFRNLGVEKALGHEEKLWTSTRPAIRLAQAYVGGGRRVYFQDDLFRIFGLDEGGSAFFIGQLTGPAQLETYGAHLLAAQDGFWVWQGQGTLASVPVPGLETIPGITPDPLFPKLIVKSNHHVLLSNGEFVFWPDVRDVTNFLADSHTTSRRLHLRDLESPILAMQVLGKGIGLYTKDHLRMLDYAGAPIWFGENPNHLDGIGAVGPNSIILAGFKNYGLSRNGIFVTDGNQFQYVDTPPFHGYLEENLNWNLADQVFGFHNEAFQEVVWFFPHVDGTIKGLGFKYTNGAFTKYNLPVRAALDRGVFDYPIFGTNTGVVLASGRSSSPSFLRSRPLDAGNSMMLKLWQHYRFVGEFQDATIRLGISDEVNTPPTYFYEGPLETAIYAEQEGVFLTIELSTSSGYFEISQILCSGQPGGFLI